MDQTLLITLATSVAFALFIFGTPVFLVMALWIVAGHLIYDFSLANIGSNMFESLNSFSLLAAPLFILTGDLIGGGGIARRMTDFTLAAFGWLRGGLALAAISACGIFAAISGSNSATTATVGSIVLPTMTEQKYDKGFAAATAASGGVVGIIIPPSLLFIIYGYVVNVPISELFLAGIIPGLIMIVAMMIACFWVSSRRGYGLIIPFRARRLAETTPGVSLAGLAVAIVIWGIYSGAFSPTEAAAVTVVYCLAVGLFVTREIKVKTLPSLIFRSGMIVGIIMPLVAMSVIMQQMFSVIGINRMIAELLGTLGGYTPILAVCMLIVLLAGTILESVPVTIVLAPILAPVAIGAGVDPFHFAVVFMVGASIGFITPPFGLNLFVASGISGASYMRIVANVVPYLVVLLISWVIIAIFPWISVYLTQFAGLTK